MTAPPLIDNIRPLDFVRPASVAELGELIRRAAAENLGLFPIGGQTELQLGLPPNKPGIAVDMTGFDQVIDYPARDMTITVRAGITMGKLQALLAAEKQRLPIDAPNDATLGGIIATNASGPRRYAYGTLRDYVIGISFMTDEGQEVKAGGRVVKNVAGYDMCKLHIGALGTLGIVTQVTLKVLPTPEDRAQGVLLLGDDEIPRFLQRVHDSKTRPVCVELLSGERGGNVDTAHMLVVGFEGNREAVAWQTETIQAELAQSSVEINRGDRTVWDSSTVTNQLIKLSFKANLLSSALPEFLSHLLKFPELSWQVHAGNGIVKVDSTADWSLAQAADVLSKLREAAVIAQGNLIITRCPPAWKRELPVWGEPRGELPLMRKVKQALDPRDLFNPGRYLV